MTQNNEREALHKIMAQVQVYASSYSLVGTRFASDNQLEEADSEKLALYNMIKSALSQLPISQNEQQEAVGVLNSTWGSDTGWQYNIKLLPSFETDKYLESIDGRDIYLYLSPTKQTPAPTTSLTSETNTEVGYE